MGRREPPKHARRRGAQAPTLAALDRLAAQIGARPAANPFVQVAALNHHLFNEAGFSGDAEDYDAPENSLLDRVLERRRGLPILLSVVYVELAERLGFCVDGVGFPGHFVVSPRGVDPRFFIDPFNGGRVLKEGDLRALLKKMAGSWDVEPETWRRFIAPVTARATLQRINNNLKRSWARRGAPEAALRATERNLVLDPESVPDACDHVALLVRLDRLQEAESLLDRLFGRDDLGTARAWLEGVAGELRLGRSTGS